jgi:alpha-tubulin suppressor-like RCC1 family protein
LVAERFRRRGHFLTRLVFSLGVLLPFFTAHILRGSWPPVWVTFGVALLGFGAGRLVEWLVLGKAGDDDVPVGRQIGGYALGLGLIVGSVWFAKTLLDPEAQRSNEAPKISLADSASIELPLSGPATIPVTLPATVTGSWRSIAVGWMQACGLHGDGSVWCWGDDRYLGANVQRSSDEPLRVLDVDRAAAVSGRWTSVCALWGGGQVSCWGDDSSASANSNGERRVPVELELKNITEIAVGSRHACALDQQSVVRCWGANGDGQLGVGTRTAHEPPSVVALQNVEHVGAGDRVSCALTLDGKTLCWGAIHVDVTNGDRKTVPTPTPIGGLERGKSLAFGDTTACVLAETGNVWCWGYVPGLGHIADTPTRVEGVSGASQVAIGTSHGCAIVTGGRVQCFGSNELGGLGSPDRRARGPLFVDSVVDAVSIAAGDFGTCAVSRDGTLTCWGLRRH